MPPTPDIAFDELLATLEQAGFPLSPADYIEFTAVFSQFTGTREEFKFYLAPILCRSREAQVKFYAIYDRYATPPEQPKPKKSEPLTNPFITENTASYFLRKASRQIYGWLFLLGVAALITKAFLLSFLATYLHPHSDIPILTPFKPDSIQVSEAPPSHERKFVVKTPKAQQKITPDEKSTLLPTGPELAKENHVHSSTFAWLFVLGLASLVLSVSFFPLKRSKSTPRTDIDDDSGDYGPLDIPFQPKDHLIQDLPILARIARDLAQPQPTDHYRLSINKTIRQSINNYGLLTPVYETIERRPEYLVLIDRDALLRGGTIRYCCATLSKYSLPIHYYFTDEIRDYQLGQRHGDALPDPLPTVLAIPSPIQTTNPTLLRNYLNDEDLFQWLCAIAVYPGIRWEVFLAVGAAVLKSRNAGYKLNVESLLKLTSIDWLNATNQTIPKNTRLTLLQNLGTREELATRQTILDLLNESDDLILNDSPAQAAKALLTQTQSFVLFAHDTKTNKSLEQEARKFITAFNRKTIPDLTTVLYLRNPSQKWSTPLRPPEASQKSVNADRFINELLALKVISDPKIRTLFRNLAASFFFILLLLYLFADNIQPIAPGLIDRDYPHGAVTVSIPLTACLKQMTKGHYLLVTLNNYDNNQYSQLFDLDKSKDTLKATFENITMTGKDPSLPALSIILNKTLTIDCPAKSYYSTYNLTISGDDCDTRLPLITPTQNRRPIPNTLQQ